MCVALAACTGGDRAEKPARAVRERAHAAPSVSDSAAAVEVALRGMELRYPRDSFPQVRYVATGYRRDGVNHIVNVALYPPDLPSVGGAGFVIVHPDGSTQLQLQQ
jgi:hypothetical protein